MRVDVAVRRLVIGLLLAFGPLAVLGGAVSALGVPRDSIGAALSWLVVGLGVVATVWSYRMRARLDRRGPMRHVGDVVAGDLVLEVRESRPRRFPRQPIGDPARPAGTAGTLRTAILNPTWATPPTKVSGKQTGGVFDPYVANGSVSVEACELTEVSFVGVQFASLHFSSSRFTRCDLRKLSVESVPQFGLGPVVFTDCRFDGADLRRASLTNTRFERCTFDGAKIADWGCETTDFVDCHFSGPIRSATFWAREPPSPIPRTRGGTDPAPRVNEFRGNDFRAAILYDVSLRGGIDVGAQLWPAGDEYIRLDRVQERARAVRAAVVTMPASPERKTMIDMLDVSLAPQFAPQTEIFARRHNPYIKDPQYHELEDRLWDMLAQADRPA